MLKQVSSRILHSNCKNFVLRPKKFRFCQSIVETTKSWKSRQYFTAHQYRCFHTSNICPFIYEKHRKGGYDCDVEDTMSTIDHIKNGFKEMKKEIILWTQEWKEKFEDDPVMDYRAGDIDIIWQFCQPETVDRFNAIADSTHNEGYSQCSFEMGNSGRALFTGYLNTTVPKDGKLRRSGYCGVKSHRVLKSFKRDTVMDWTQYNTIVLKVRGDGRTYMVNLSVDGEHDITWNDMYHHPLYTRGGPYWQLTKIPFSKFFYGAKGRIQDRQTRIPLYRITHFGIGLSDRINGPFALDIEYVGLEFDPQNTEEFAYELYRTDPGIAGV